jgi:hypothetical protein
VPDLAIIVPTRGRPRNLARLLDAVHTTMRLDTHVWAGVDDDDPELAAYRRVFRARRGPGDRLLTGPRDGLTGWTNKIAAKTAVKYPFLGSFGDDHVPQTPAFDRKLVTAIRDMGGTGFAYPFDGNRDDVPEAVVMSASIVRALGWMALPSSTHWFIDDTWADLGRGAGCLRYCRAVAVPHAHPIATGQPADRLYRDNAKKIGPDRDAWSAWREAQMAGDVAKILALRQVKETTARQRNAGKPAS